MIMDAVGRLGETVGILARCSKGVLLFGMLDKGEQSGVILL